MGIGASMGSGIRGFQQARDWRANDEARQYAMERQGVDDQQRDTEFAQQQADRQEFDLPEKRDRQALTKQQRRKAQIKERIGTAYATKNLDELARIYSEDVPDGHTAKMSWTPDGMVQIDHPKGKVIASLDDVVFGKEDGSGAGLIDLIDLDVPMVRRSKAADRKAKLEDTSAEYGMRGKLAEQEHGLAMRRLGAEGAQTRQNQMLSGSNAFQGDDGAMYMLRPDGSTVAVQQPGGGGPMKAPAGGMGSGFGGRGRGATADIENNRYDARMAVMADQSGLLADMPGEQVEAMVWAAKKAGKDRVARQKILSSLMGKAYSKWETPQQIAQRVQAMDQAMESMLGPMPSVRGGAQPQMGSPDEDPLGFFGGGDGFQ